VEILRRGAARAWALLALLSPVAVLAATPLPTEYEVKAAFMYNFVRFVEWPAAGAPHDSFVVGVLGDDPFGSTLDRTFAGKKLQERPLVVKRVAGPEDVAGVDLLFIAASESARLPRILERLAGKPTLTVSDIPDFVSRGGMVGFRIQDDTVRFDINLLPVHDAKLKMSSQLVRVARKVMPVKINGS
jgi:hypothetical protein